MVRSIDLPDPVPPNDKEMLVPDTRDEWREWLDANSNRTEGIWVVYPNKRGGVQGPAYEELVEEALCFGWIDSVNRSAGDGRQLQWFSPRRKGGIWSALNKQRIERLVAEGRMTERGQAAIDAAKADGSWSQFDDVDALVIHSDLQEAFDADSAAVTRWETVSPSQKKQDLWWVYSAKRPETRAKRIEELVRRLAET